MNCFSIRSIAILSITVVMFATTWASHADAQLFRRSQRSQPTQPAQRSTQPATSSASQHWASSFTPNAKVKDFGAVPRASKQEFVFEFENTLEQPIYLTGVRTSCGCTKPKILTPEVKPGETAKIHAKYDTVGFKGNRKATVTVSLRRSQPRTQYGEIQFMVKGQIRQDVVFSPAEIKFEKVTSGEDQARTAKIMFAGSANWEIIDVISTNPNITVEKIELRRDLRSRRIDYQLNVKLNGNQPVGLFNDQLTLVTNDANQKQLTVGVLGNVQSILEVKPVHLGVIEKDKKIEKKLIIRSSRPFEIRSVKAGDQRIRFEESEGKKTLHILNYKLDTSEIGKISTKIQIETDDPAQPLAIVDFDVQIESETFTLNDK